MRISDWSSDVCSSDLQSPQLHNQAHRERQARVTILATPSRCGSVSACSGFNIRFFVEASAVRSEVPPTCDQALESNFGLTSSAIRSEEHTSELQSLMRISYAVFCLKKKTLKITTQYIYT